MELDAARADAWNLLGTLHHSRGALEDAQKALAHAISLQPDDATMRANLATALRATGRFGESLTELRTAAALQPDAPLPAALAFAPAAIDDDAPAGGAPPPAWRVAATARDAALPERTPSAWREALRRVCVTRVADASECDWAIAAAEAHAAARGGWDGRGQCATAGETRRTNAGKSPFRRRGRGSQSRHAPHQRHRRRRVRAVVRMGAGETDVAHMAGAGRAV